jgi:hypothetical protein
MRSSIFSWGRRLKYSPKSCGGAEERSFISSASGKVKVGAAWRALTSSSRAGSKAPGHETEKNKKEKAVLKREHFFMMIAMSPFVGGIRRSALLRRSEDL